MGGIYWLASYPKSGNTWMRAFLQNLRDDGEAPADINALHTGITASVRGWLDEVLGFDTATLRPEEVDALRPLVYRWEARQDGVAYHKIHDACRLLADGEPLIGREATLGALYMIRNPLDVANSYASHNGTTIDGAIAAMGDPGHGLALSRDALRGQVAQPLLTWSQHVSSWVDAGWLDCRVVRYEDMRADPLATFAGAARFLGLPDTPARVEKAIRFSAFDELQRQERAKGFHERPPRVETFFREGRSGGWRGALSDAQIARIIADHGAVMRRFSYLDAAGNPA